MFFWNLQKALVVRTTPQLEELRLRQGLLRDAVTAAKAKSRTAKRAADKLNSELAEDRAALEEFASEADTAEADFADNTQDIHCNLKSMCQPLALSLLQNYNSRREHRQGRVCGTLRRWTYMIIALH